MILLFHNSYFFHHIVRFDLVHHILSLDHLTEHGMHAVKMGLRGVGDKELAAACILSCMGHGKGAC